ncbi:uncharacterized protein PG986_001491 [Apiospora aurea]|uniref:Reverse transcriptase domain-containing protein n=1 Tax=Apiospora aurea TaxID=335848 RepID=A0ABR1QX58_9PEZI
MASSSGSVFSETLKEITDTKLQELSKRRAAFEEKRSAILSSLNDHDRIKRLVTLGDGVKSCYAIKLDSSGRVADTFAKHTSLEVELKNLDSFIAQARYDPSVSTKTLEKWETSLLGHLDTMSLKYAYASLYAQLVTEWLAPESPSDPSPGPSGAGDDEEMTEPFETIESAKRLEAKQQWEQDVFVPAQVDEAKLTRFLKEIFVNEPADSSKKAKALDKLAESIKDFEYKLSVPNQFNAYTLKWVIEGLLASDRLSNEKREALRDFVKNDIILGEIADVLNMRLSALDAWSWGDNVPLEQRRKISGVYSIHMDEELLQSIFLQYIGVTWSVFFKRAFKRFRRIGGPWADVRQPIPELDKLRREYYLEDGVSKWQNDSVQHVRRSMHRKDYFMARLLDKESQQVEIVEGEEEVEHYSAASPVAMMASVAPKRKRLASKAARKSAPSTGMRSVPENSETESDREPEYAKKNPMQTKQRLLHILSTEAIVCSSIHNDFTALHSSFDRWDSLLPHTTIHTILSFFGVSDTWLRFFAKFLEVPLRFMDEPANTAARTRCRGTPTSHTLSDVFGEVVFFCLDFATNQSTNGSLLYRLYDDVWFWSASHETVVQAWATLQKFAAVTGTQLNTTKTGCIRISGDPDVTPAIHSSLPRGDIQWGFLKLSPQTGRFEINQALVDSHIAELRRQLQTKKTSVFSFIQTWNSFANTFFASNFGEAANCFGRSHVDAMLETHSRIQREVFRAGAAGEVEANSVVEYLKALLCQRYGVEEIPDAFLFFPVELGGLDLQSPFVSILQVRDSILADPSSLMEAFKKAEVEAYRTAKENFEELDPTDRHHSWVPQGPGEADTFFSLEEYARWREELWYSYDMELVDVYRELLKRPGHGGGIEMDEAGVVASGLAALGADGSYTNATLRSGIKSDWHSMQPYWRWIVALYGPEVVARFGGLRLVDPGLLPMGMVSLFREKRLSWQD